MVDAWLSACIITGAVLGRSSEAARAGAWAVLAAPIGILLAYQDGFIGALVLALSSSFAVQAAFMTIGLASTLISSRSVGAPSRIA